MIKILAVDDMPQWRNFHSHALNTILQDTEFELTLKNSASEAFEDIQEKIQTPYNLIISDLQMESDFEPEHAGEWLIRNIQSLPQYANTPKIIVSAAYNIKFIAENLGVDCIPKPLLVNSLLTYELKIKELLNC